MFWLRLWHDMIRDPKWRLVSRRSGQPVHAVIAVAIALMINASENHEQRGTLNRWSDDVEGAALDLEGEQVAAIRHAMQGLFLDEERLSGWQARQPERNDDSRDRMRRYRDRKRSSSVTPSDASVTPGDAKVTRSDGLEPEQEKELESKSPLAPDSRSARVTAERNGDRHANGAEAMASEQVKAAITPHTRLRDAKLLGIADDDRVEIKPKPVQASPSLRALNAEQMKTSRNGGRL